MFNSELNSSVCCSRDINKYIVDIGFFLDAIDNTFTKTSNLILRWSHTWIILNHLNSYNTAISGTPDMYTQSPRAAGLMIYISGRLWVAVLQLLCYTFLVRVKLWLYIWCGLWVWLWVFDMIWWDSLVYRERFNMCFLGSM